MNPTPTPTPGDGKDLTDCNIECLRDGSLRPSELTSMTLPLTSTLDPATVRVMCAEEMGWTAITSDAIGNPPNSRGNADHWHIPDYSMSADAALALVEKMEGSGFSVALDNCLSDEWNCGFMFITPEDITQFQATAPTLALAICRAFLKARGRAL